MALTSRSVLSGFGVYRGHPVRVRHPVLARGCSSHNSPAWSHAIQWSSAKRTCIDEWL